MTSPSREPLIVCDASPLILLAKLGRVDLLPALAEEIWIPEAVWNEVVVNGGSRSEIASIVNLLSGCVKQADPALEAAFRIQVDAGEAAALALVSRHTHACLLMDDRRGRAVANLHGWRCIGTLGWLVRAKRKGHIEQLRPLFDQLSAAGWFIDPRLVNKTLAAVGE